MKKILTIALLSISLSGISQTMKGDWVITPTVGWNTLKIDNTSERDILGINFPTVFHKYLSDKFAIGCGLEFTYNSVKSYVVNSYPYNSTLIIGLVPEVRYNFLKTRLTPFVSGRFVESGYSRFVVDDPSIPVVLRTRNNWYLNTRPQIDVGVSYFIKERLGLQVKLMNVSTWDFKGVNTNFYTRINFGLQFIINNPRPEIESPR
jgi:hypothetical protein